MESRSCGPVIFQRRKQSRHIAHPRVCLRVPNEFHLCHLVLEYDGVSPLKRLNKIGKWEEAVEPSI